MNRQNLMGFELLRKQTIDAALEHFEEVVADASGDSQIERLFSAALQMRIEHGFCEYGDVLIAEDENHASALRNHMSARLNLIIESQVHIDAYRVDFVISAWTYGRVWGGKDGPVDGPERWRKLIVECDGHEFHERTKEQAARDRSRDRHLTQAGFDVFRFTGSELWRDPWECADQVYQWASKGLG